jgi:signal transduction histidine kinase/DNA-binding response OmpR family regulator
MTDPYACGTAHAPAWVIAVVDDEPDVHEVTSLVLGDLAYDGRPVEIVGAHSLREGRQLFAQRRDIAVALIDVVMEHDRAGLDLVQFLRTDLGNKLTRVILRTGQPGSAPERDIVTHFEIDDYREKTELTADRMHTAVYAALRSYQALLSLQQTRNGLSRIADAAGRLMGYDSTERFFAEALVEMAGMAAMVAGAPARDDAAVLVPDAVAGAVSGSVSGAVAGVDPGADSGAEAGIQPVPDAHAHAHAHADADADADGNAQRAALPDGLAVMLFGGDAGTHPAPRVLAGTGEFADPAGQPLDVQLGAALADRLVQVAQEGGMGRDEDGAWLGLDAGNGRRCALWVRCAVAPSKEVAALWQVFATKLADVARARRAIEARTEMAAAERELQAKSRFLSRMSHELRTPLNAMLGFTQLMLTEREPEREPEGRLEGESDARHQALRRERLQHVATAGRHLLSLIDDVLDLSRLEGGEVALRLESVPSAPLIEEVLPLVATLAREHQVTIHVEPCDAVLRADATRLRQVLLNLLTNAIKYNRPGGTVTVRTALAGPGDYTGPGPSGLSGPGPGDSSDPGPGEPAASGGLVRMQVIDTGRGLTPAQIRQLFQPFNRLGAEASGVEGTGIGLAIVKGLVERMGGVITVSSGPGVGSTFTVALPPGEAAPVTPQESFLAAVPLASVSTSVHAQGDGGHDRDHVRSSASDVRVLYIEDNPVNAMIVAELLKRVPGLVLELAEDGAQGLAAARASRPDLILLDMQLPDMDGLAVFRSLQDDPRTRGLPCVALSANALPSDIAQARQAGFADYLTKPFEFEDFLAVLRRHLQRHLQRPV